MAELRERLRNGGFREESKSFFAVFVDEGLCSAAEARRARWSAHRAEYGSLYLILSSVILASFAYRLRRGKAAPLEGRSVREGPYFTSWGVSRYACHAGAPTRAPPSRLRHHPDSVKCLSRSYSQTSRSRRRVRPGSSSWRVSPPASTGRAGRRRSRPAGAPTGIVAARRQCDRGRQHRVRGRGHHPCAASSTAASVRVKAVGSTSAATIPRALCACRWPTSCPGRRSAEPTLAPVAARDSVPMLPRSDATPASAVR